MTTLLRRLRAALGPAKADVPLVPLTPGERRAETVVGGGFLLACAALALALPWTAFSAGPTIVLVLVMAVASRVRFPVMGGFTVPLVLAFVPMLFAVPLPAVPMLTALALALAATPDVLRRRLPPSRLLFAFANSWFSVGPVLVLGLAGVSHPRDATAALLLVALAAQFATDFAASHARELMIGGAPLREQIADVMWVYAVDAALAPVGLLAAIAGPESGYAVLMLLPLLGLLRLFAAERRQRLDNLSELSAAYRGTALVLADVVEADDTYTGEHCKESWSSRSPSRPRWASTPAGAATSSSAPSCTTSARSPSRRRSSTRRVRSTTTSGRSSAPTPSRATGCWTPSAA